MRRRKEHEIKNVIQFEAKYKKKCTGMMHENVSRSLAHAFDITREVTGTSQ